MNERLDVLSGIDEDCPSSDMSAFIRDGSKVSAMFNTDKVNTSSFEEEILIGFLRDYLDYEDETDDQAREFIAWFSAFKFHCIGKVAKSVSFESLSRKAMELYISTEVITQSTQKNRDGNDNTFESPLDWIQMQMIITRAKSIAIEDSGFETV